MSTLVIKLGGAVLSKDNAIRDAIDIIVAQHAIWGQVVVVTSALSGVTNTLHEIVQIAESGKINELRAEMAKLRNLHIDTAQQAIQNPRQLETLIRELDLIFFNAMDDCEALVRKNQARAPLADRIVAIGEQLIIRILAAAARANGLKCIAVDTTRIIVTDDRHSNARPIFHLSKQNIEQNLTPLLQHKIVPIVTGYIGATEKGAVTTLGRGGSDYSATYLGALLQADEVWFFTDVDGLMTADPALVRSARVLPTSSYREVAELAQFGAQVLHPRAVEPLIQHNIPLRIRSFEHPQHLGTYICDHIPARNHRIHAVTQVLGVLVEGPGQSNVAEACNRLFSTYLSDDIQPTLQVGMNASNVLVYVSPTSANKEAFRQAVQRLQSDPTSEDWRIHEVTVIAVIGNLILEDNIAILRALSRVHVIPEACGNGLQGAAVVVVPPEKADLALNSIHELISR